VSNQKAPIIKKVKKVVAGGAHGGAWKVAYADFVTAMMAFFLLMWLLNMSSPEKRVRLSYHFKTFSLFKEAGQSFMGKSDQMFNETGETAQKAFEDNQEDKKKSSNKNEVLALNEKIDLSKWRNKGGDIGRSDKNQRGFNLAKDDAQTGSKIVFADTISKKYIEGIEKALKQDILEKLGDLKDQVLVDTVEDGVRIQMIDKKGSEMFEVGSNKLTEKAKEVLHVIGGNINKLPNKVIIEGHTDSIPYSGSQYSNWELSTERASSARRELEATGLDPERIIRVAGYADTEPLIKENSADPRNRRISITLKIPLTKTQDNTTDKELQTKKDETGIAIKKDQKLPALIIPGKKPAAKKKDIPLKIEKDGSALTGGKPGSVKDKGFDKASKDTGWSPVINKMTKDPFVEPAINLSKKNSAMIKNDWVPKSVKSNKPAVKKNIKKPVVKKAVKKSAPAKDSKITFSKPLKKLAPLISQKEKQDAKQKAGKDQWNPVVRENTWNPVLKKNSWNPVLNND
jgi:chemotaxis protein MotB